MKIKHAAVITAAGSSTRLGLGKKKEFLPLFKFGEGISVLSQSVYVFFKTGLFSFIVITVPQGKIEETHALLRKDGRLSNLLAGSLNCALCLAEGGSTRQISVFNGLKILKEKKDSGAEFETVFIHDGARPLVSEKLINRVSETAMRHGAALPALQVLETPKIVNRQGEIIQHPERETVFLAQTPQAFNFENLFSANLKASSENENFTDDSGLYAKYCSSVFVCAGEKSNIKITYKEDLDYL